MTTVVFSSEVCSTSTAMSSRTLLFSHVYHKQFEYILKPLVAHEINFPLSYSYENEFIVLADWMVLR